MSKREWFFASLLALPGCAAGGPSHDVGVKPSASANHEPSVPCSTTDSGYCVTFGTQDLSGKPINLMDKSQSKPRVSILGVANASVFNTTTPVKLAKQTDLTQCTEDPKNIPMNVDGSELIVAENGAQYLYLIFKDKVLKRKAVGVARNDEDGTNSTYWLQAQSSGSDGDTFDYFVEFNAKTSKNMKAFRVEAFPHLAADATPKTECDCERPDVIFPIVEGKDAFCKARSRARPFFEPTVGEGNEPGHG